MPYVKRSRNEPVAFGKLPGTYVEDPEGPPGTSPEVYRRYIQMPMEVRDYFHGYLTTYQQMGMTIDEASLTRMMDAAEANFEAEYGMPAPEVTYQRPRQHHDEVVYYLQLRDLIKIGWTINIHQRISQLPHDKLLAVEWGGRKVEVGRHEQFSAYRRQGEWFHLAEPILKHVASARKRFEADVSMDTESWMQHLLAKRSSTV